MSRIRSAPSAPEPEAASSIELRAEDSDAFVGQQIKELLRAHGAEVLVIQTGPECASAGAETAEPAAARKRLLAVLATPDGERTSAQAGPGQEPSASERLQDALVEARARGRALAAASLSGEEMLNGAQFGARIGISRQAVDKRRRHGEVLGLEGPSRGIRYPAWQITPTGLMLPGLREILRLADDEPWTAYRMLTETFPDGSGERLYEKLKAGEVERVTSHVDGIMHGSFT